MRKIAVVFVVLMCGFALLSCGTAPETRPGGEVTQESINLALGQIYTIYREKLDFTGAQEYVVVRGDTLSEITRRFYGNLTNVGDAGSNNGFYFPVIMMASDSHIVDPDFIEPGMRLTIIDLRRNLDNPVARQAIKEALIDVSHVYERRGRTAEQDGLRRLAYSL